LLHQTLKKVGADIEAFKFNTAIAQMMVFLNHLEARKSVTPEVLEAFVKMLSPFAPHMCDELWEKMGKKTLVIEEQWPLYDAALAAEDEITLVIQVNGKVRDKITVLAGLGDADLEARALASEKLQEWVKGKKVVKIIVARGKLVNIVVV
jgi:leucyl-tRNA synthetase